ncbi:MAG: hypothetical protein RRA94_07370 [Bacteroidota bacterium]|nr:hypothetical protein [Bacteroidota bacterium]
MKRGFAWLFLFLLPPLLAALALVFLLIDGGVSFTTDSFSYMAIARYFADSAAYVDYLDIPVALWPPLLPALLALLHMLGISDPDVLAALLNPACYLVSLGSMIWLLGRAMEKQDRRHLPWIAVAVVLLSWPLFKISLWMLSEPLFVATVSVFFVAAFHYHEKQSRGPLLLMGLAAALAVMTRYSGVTVIATGIVFIALSSAVLRRKMLHTLLFACLSLLPLLLWLLRNYAQHGRLTGPRLPSTLSLSDAVVDLFEATLRWYLPGSVMSPSLLDFLLLLFVLGWIWMLRQQRFRTHAASHIVVLLAIFVLLFSVFMIATSTTVRMDRLGTRLLLPLSLPLSLLLVLWIRWTLSLLPLHRFLRTGFVVAALLVISYIPYHRLSGMRDYRAEGWTATEWRENALLPRAGEILSTRPDAYVLSNLPFVLSWYTDVRVRRSLVVPDGDHADPAAHATQLHHFRELLGEGRPVCLVWFNWEGYGNVLPPVRLAHYFELDTLLAMEEGYVLELRESQVGETFPNETMK